MTIRSSASTNASMSTDPSAFAGLVFFLSASFVLFLSAGFLMLVVQDMIKAFYMGKPVTSADKTIALMYIKRA